MKILMIILAGIGILALTTFAFVFVPLVSVVVWPPLFLGFMAYGFAERSRAGHWPPVFQAMFNVSTPRIVVIEDDMDIVLMLKAVFKKLGYPIAWISGADPQAGKHLAEFKADYVLLDWRLGGELTGRDVIGSALSSIESEPGLRQAYQGHKMRVVTFSAAGRSEIRLPESEYYSYFRHWKKNMHFGDLTRNVAALVKV